MQKNARGRERGSGLRKFLLVRAGIVWGLLWLGSVNAWSEDGPLGERLRNRLESAEGPGLITAAGQLVQCETTVVRFYQTNGFVPIWLADGLPSAGLDSLLDVLAGAGAEGLDPGDYHLEVLRTMAETAIGARQGPVTDGALVDLELLATDAFLLCASHFLAGKIDPTDLDPEWVASRRQADLAEVLAQAVGDMAPAAALRGLLPPQPGYGRLKGALAEFRDLVRRGGWPMVSEGPKLERGDRGPRVGELRRRLAVRVTGLPPGPSDTDSELFDEDLLGAVKRFQGAHGLEDDGIVGRATLAALNVSADQRVRQLEVNLERWRWLPQELGSPHILVNIADFRLDVREKGTSVLTLPVIVGRNYRRTPVFSAPMTYLVFSPSWEVPPKLAAVDKLPLIKKDPGYLEQYGFQVLQGWGRDEKIIDPATVLWNELSARRFPYRLRQLPGPLNALGGVKFMFPNQFDVYIHDTPSRELFRKTERTFSSGCIRVEHPEELAVLLLAGRPEWPRTAVLEAMESGREQTVRLTRPIPVHLEYWTAWVEADGAVQFRNDIYQRDAVLGAALETSPPLPVAPEPIHGG